MERNCSFSTHAVPICVEVNAHAPEPPIAWRGHAIPCGFRRGDEAVDKAMPGRKARRPFERLARTLPVQHRFTIATGDPCSSKR